MLSFLKSRPLYSLACALFLLAASAFITACGSPHASQPTLTPSPAPTDASYAMSNGGGEPRGAAYWLLWNSCAPDNRAAVAASNGGRGMGWFILDDLLVDPGVMVGNVEVLSCPQGLQLLQLQDVQGASHPDDPAYQLAAALLTAQLNLAAGAEYCPAVDDTVHLSQLLLLDIDFSAQGDYPAAIQAKNAAQAAAHLLEQLSSYNLGTLCR